MALLPSLPGGVMTNPFGISNMSVQPAAHIDAGRGAAWWQPFTNAVLHQHVHMGVDFAGKPAGSPLVAVESGKVVHVGYDDVNGGGWQIRVEIRPGTTYSHNHCQSIANDPKTGKRYAPGAIVTKGQTIAHVGATGTILRPDGTRVRSTYGVHNHSVLQLDREVAGKIIRPMFFDITMFMAGGIHANRIDIQPVYANPPQRISIGANVNIRRGPGTSHAIARTTTAAGQYNSPHPYEIAGQNLTQNGVTSNMWRTVDLSGVGVCYVWSPLAKRV
jgi:murein DD-endopeptidase MepM/ murein hydrolase activator NlpD